MGRITETVKILIIINVIVYAGSLFLGDVAYRLFSLYYFENPDFQLWQPITHMFMHDQNSFAHILFNMFGLYMFGSPLEAQWGRNKFLFFYFSAGLGAALIHSLVAYFQVHQGMDALLSAGLSQTEITTLLNTGTYRSSILEVVPVETIQGVYESFNTPAVGASGAIYGVLVAFGLMYPNAELMLIFLPIPIKAKFFIPGILLLDLFSGLTGFSLFGQNIANWAHLGGALFGFIMAYYWKKNSMNNTRWD
ncbi:MAG: rhomboid family intramembrane serine protease [Patiriisocius sp.]|uniref:rhomboid family intramembrane serine protease n=1 Tax=Patiriisocius sp. TaxID=2822396 RepID=UPI003EF601CE